MPKWILTSNSNSGPLSNGKNVVHSERDLKRRLREAKRAGVQVEAKKVED